MEKLQGIIIPAYEPDERLLKLLCELHENSNAKLIIVNDGSNKEKKRIFTEAEKYGVVLAHDKNYGKGKAVKTALEYIKDQRLIGNVVIADADGQHDVNDIIFLLKKSAQNPRSLVIGVRDFQGKVPLRSQFGNQITKVMFRLLSGKWLKDTQTGLRSFDTSLIPWLLAIPGERYEYETNVLLMCVKESIPIVEIPIETIYLDGNQSSHFRVVKDSLKIYKNMFRFASSSFVSFCLDYLLYGVFFHITSVFGLSSSVIISNTLARIISASFNYQLNRRYVFRHEGGLWKTALGYAALALAILLVNTAFLLWFITGKGVGGMAAKMVVEIMLFFVSFLIQKLLIFGKGKITIKNT